MILSRPELEELTERKHGSRLGNAMKDDLLTIEDIAQRLGASVRTVRDRWVHKPDFPLPRYAPTRKARQWLASEVDEWATPAERKSLPQTPGNTRGTAGTRPGGR